MRTAQSGPASASLTDNENNLTSSAFPPAWKMTNFKDFLPLAEAELQ